MRVGLASITGRIVVWVSLFVTFGFAASQGVSHFDFRDLLASDLDAVAMECPFAAPDATFACIRHWGPQDLVRMEITLKLENYSDVKPVTPWDQLEQGHVGRAYTIEMDGRNYAFHVIVDGDFPGFTDTLIAIASLDD